MKILQPGRIPSVEILFHCKNCDCVFVATETETEKTPIPFIAYQRKEVSKRNDINGYLHSCKCPTCQEVIDDGVRHCDNELL